MARGSLIYCIVENFRELMENRFSWRKLLQIARYCHQRMPHPQSFANSHKTSIFTTIFPLYGVCTQPCSTVNDRSWVECLGVKLVALPFSCSPEPTACWLEYDRLKTWPVETHDKCSLHKAETWLRSWIPFWITYLYSGSSSSFIWREGNAVICEECVHSKYDYDIKH